MSAGQLIQQAMALLRQGAVVDAVNLIVAAPASYRNTQAAQRTLAAAHAQAGDLALAQAAIQRALLLLPTEPATRALAGRIALDQKFPERAFPHFEALVQLAPAQMGFWRYLWDAASTPATSARALQLTESHAIDSSADVHLAWAVSRALASQSQTGKAIALARQTFLRHPEDAAAQWLWVKRLTDEAPLTALQGLADCPLPPLTELTPDSVDARLTVPENYPDDAAIDAWRTRYGDGLAQIAEATAAALDHEKRLALVRHTAFRLAYHGKNDLELQSARGDWLASLMRPLAPLPVNRCPSRGSKIRVAFASKHIRDCTVGQYFKHFFTHLTTKDDEHIEVFIYACGKRDAFTDEVQISVAKLMQFADEDTALLAMANAIAADTPDVLIYPEIGMEPIIEKLAAMRLAPLQCMLWGHPVTSGLPTIDVFFSAEALEPADAQTHYREQLHLLPGLGTCYPQPPRPSAATRSQLGLPDEAPLAVCAQSPFKWSPQFTCVVGEILTQSADAKLVVFDSPVGNRKSAFDSYLEHFFAPLGVDVANRVIRMPQQSRTDFLAVLSSCDIALDTFGFSGGNTSLDSLSVGLPVITLPGEFMRGRQTFAMVRMLPVAVQNELIALDATDFAARALNLLRNRHACAALRSVIQSHAHQLFDAPEPVREMRAWVMQKRNV
ncbi:MAG: hypothetical protein ABIZ64_06470 [Casimicrobium sp.]